MSKFNFVTGTGIFMDLLNPKPEDIRFADISRALSQQCRFGGHTGLFYSVAEHSICVSRAVSPENRMVALFHDATEAYCVDVPRPLKAILGTAYQDVEKKLWTAIAKAFDLPEEIPEEVLLADNKALKGEMERFFPFVDFELLLPDFERLPTMSYHDPGQSFIQEYRKICSMNNLKDKSMEGYSWN